MARIASKYTLIKYCTPETDLTQLDTRDPVADVEVAPAEERRAARQSGNLLILAIQRLRRCTRDNNLINFP